MNGTYRVNGELRTMEPYGCHSTRAPDRHSIPVVRHGNGHIGKAKWPHAMSTDCRYDKQDSDERCANCNQEKHDGR